MTQSPQENSDFSLDHWALRMVNFGGPYLITQPLDGAVILWTYYVDVMYYQLKFQNHPTIGTSIIWFQVKTAHCWQLVNYLCF